MNIKQLVKALEELRAKVGNVPINALNKDGDSAEVKSIQDVFTIRGDKEFTRYTLSTEE